MKHTLILAAVLAALALSARAQLADTDKPALTNNVQFVWNQAQTEALVACWKDDFAAAQAAWRAATNANPDYATTNAAPTRPAFAVWAAAAMKAQIAAPMMLLDAQRQWRTKLVLQQQYAADAALFEQAWANLTPATRNTISNLLQAAAP